MKSLRVSLHLPAAFVHPMHAFVADTPGFRRTSLLHWNPAVGERNTLTFYVDGDDPATYADATEATSSIIDAEVVPADGRRGFYLAVQEGQREADAALTDAFVGVVVVVRPVSFLSDRRIELSLVGSSETLDEALDRLDCSTGTAAEHLRKAESTVFERLVRTGPTSW